MLEHQLIDLHESVKEQKEIFTLSNHQAPLHCIIPTRIPPSRVNSIKFSLGVKLLAIIKSILEFFFYHNILQFNIL